MKRFSLLVAAAAIAASACAGEVKLALQAYTFRDRSFADTLAVAERLGFERIEAYPGQRLGANLQGTTDYKTISPESLAGLKKLVDCSKVKLVSYGVTGAGSDEEWEKLMAFCKTLGIGNVEIEAGASKGTLEKASKASKKHGVLVSIHNHTQPAGKPAAVLAAIEGFGPEIGAGCDIGHWERSGENAVAGVKTLKGRFHEIHLIDVGPESVKHRDLPLGAGIIDVKSVLDLLKAEKNDVLAVVEYEHQSFCLESEVAACVRWFKAWEKGLIGDDNKLPSKDVAALWCGVKGGENSDTWAAAVEAKEAAAAAAKLASLKRIAIDPAAIKADHPGFNAKEGPARGFIAEKGAKYCRPFSGKAVIEFSLAAPAAPKCYSIQASGDAPGRDPASWTLSASADGEKWEVIDSRKDQQFAFRGMLRSFDIAKPAAYRFFRLEVLETAGDDKMQFSNFGIYE